MPDLSDLRYAPRLTMEDADAENDLVPVYHPSGGFATNCAMPLSELTGGGGGSGANTFLYKTDLSSETMSDPGKGKFRYNAEDQVSSTMMCFDWLTVDGFDPVLMFQTFTVGATFIIQETDFSINHQIWRMPAPAENGPDYFVVPVEFVSSSGTNTFKNQLPVTVILQIAATVRSLPDLPTSPAGLAVGSLWNNRGVLHIVC